MLGIIFDMDGTLLDTQRIFIAAWDTVGAAHGFGPLGRHIPDCCGMSAEAWQRYLIERYPTIDIPRFHADTKEYISRHLVVRFKEGAGTLIAFLKEHHIPFAIASGSSHALIEHHFESLGGLADYAAVVGGDEAQHSKPAPDIFLLAAQKMGLAPEDCIVFEDSPNGVLAAHAAGMSCIGVPDVAVFSKEIKEILLAELPSLDRAIPLIQNRL